MQKHTSPLRIAGSKRSLKLYRWNVLAGDAEPATLESALARAGEAASGDRLAEYGLT